ncbi:hypothetical protein [Effusibacillus consociatus]|uniref:Uncharacterized protein n=1 Tax=Effusibacillus consociatus TaxID=1117041 RepID=A0ABV9Q5H1_9BACL
MVLYKYDHDALEITEQRNGDDFEFWIKAKNDESLRGLHQVRSFFDHNRIHTDVLFYTHHEHEFQVIVRKDFHIDFLLSLFKHCLLKSLTWE